ncbi:unnamed protein product [Cunninghamella echinulata]
MPLLNKKRLPLQPPMGWERKKRRKEVYYLKCTNEVFPSYDSYIKRWMLCQRPIWECEVTGRQELTYQQAKESEKSQEKRIELKFCPVLRKRLLSFIQFQTIGLDDLVNKLYDTFQYSYSIDEVVQCFLGGHTYIGKIMDIFPNPNYVTPIAIKEEEDNTNETNMPRQANGRLRFPDAFLHPQVETSPTSTTSGKRHLLPSEKYKHRYSIQLIDNQGENLENTQRTIDHHELSHDPYTFNISNLQQLIRECATRDSYQGAPWILKENVANHYDITTELPSHLQKLQDVTYQTIIKKRQYNRKANGHSNINSQLSQGNGNGITSTWSIHSPSSYNKEEREAERQARKEEHLRLKLQRKLEKERLREERKRQAAVKYPIEDLDLPIYRKDPNQNWALVDMTPTNNNSPLTITSTIDPKQQKQNDFKEIKIENNNPLHNINTDDVINNIENNENNNNEMINNNNLDIKEKDTKKSIHIPYPSGGRGPRPIPRPKSLNNLTEENFDDLISIWSFLTVFSVPLKLNTMTIDTFEHALLATTTSVSTNTAPSPMIQAFIVLLNVIITERQQNTTSDLLNGDIMEIYLEDHPSESEQDSDDENEDDEEEDDDDGDDDEKEKKAYKSKKSGKKVNKKKNDSNEEDDDEDEKEDDDSDSERMKKRRGRRRKEEKKDTNSIKNNNHNNHNTNNYSNNNSTTNNNTKSNNNSNEDINVIGWRLKEPLRLCKDWDQKEIRLDRGPSAIKNWITSLIGCLNDIATPDLIPNINEILNHLIPRPHSTIAERDRQFLSLSLSCKLQLLSFLVMVVNESLIIKNYMDECQEQMTELRRQKMDLNKEYRSLMVRKSSFEKQERKKKQKEKDSGEDNNDGNESAVDEDDEDDENDESNEDSNDESNIDEDEDDEDNNQNNNSDDEMEDTLEDSETQSYDSQIDDEDSEVAEQSDSSKQAIRRSRKKQRVTKYGQLHQSRKAKLQQKKIKQIAMEELKRRRYEKKREEAKLKIQANKEKAENKRILEEDEQNLKRKEEQLEREMRQYMTLRIRPLGKDRFYNRYFYLDNVGIKDHHGTGRLYVQNPTYLDVLQMMNRDLNNNNSGQQNEKGEDEQEPAWGRGGGRDFILALMKEQGLLVEATWLEKRINQLQQDMDQLDIIKKEHDSKINHSLCSKHALLNQHIHNQKEKGWWHYYSDPEEIQQLLAWLNPKGIREYKLRNEIVKQQHLITESMEKRDKVKKKKKKKIDLMIIIK